MKESLGEKRDFEVSPKSGMSTRGTFYRLAFAGGLLLGASGCSVINAESSENETDTSPRTELYNDGEQFQHDFLTEDICEVPSYIEGEATPAFVIEEREGSLPDWEGLEDVDFAHIDSSEIVAEEEAISEEIGEDSTDLGVPKIEEMLNEEVREILSLTTKLEFGNDGNLFFEDNTGEIKPVLLFETERHLTHPYTPVEEVKFFVIHYDASPLRLASGDYRTVFNTLNGLNRKEKPSVQFCVDPYPITGDLTQDSGLGLILSQEPNEVPYKGRHVQIGINLETGAEDVDRIKTAKLYEEIEVGSDFIDFVNSGEKDFDSYSLAVEQVGVNYSLNFPEQFPPRQQIANMVSLSKAVAKHYDLSVWNIVGYGEIQEKSDPGEEYMLTLRYLLGIEYVRERDEFPEGFLEGDNLYDFFFKLREYGISKMGDERYMEWDAIYGLDNIVLNEEFWEESGRRVVSQEEREFLANHEVYSGDKERQVAIMTYDDGGSEEYIEHIMSVYEKYDLKTTFFVTGQWVERNSELVKDMIDRGFEIGCHGWDHSEMSVLSGNEVRGQIEDFLLAMKGVDSFYEVRLIRFPYGSRTQESREIAAEFGLQSIMWSYESGGMDDTTFDNVMRHLDWGSIILSHSTRYYDVYEAERILQALLEQGYEVTTVSEGIAKEMKYNDVDAFKTGEGRSMEWLEGYGGLGIVANFTEGKERQEEVNLKDEEISRELVAYEAILAATREFAGKPYSWNAENHHCSGYVAQYFKYLGFPIDLVTDPVSTYSPKRGDPMPNATTVKQVPYLKMIAENYGKDLASEITLEEMLSNKGIWKEIPAGTVLYLPERIGHHGYDTYTHTAIFMGLDSNNEPVFSEFSSYMKQGPEYGHGFEQFTLMYKGQNIEPYNPRNGELKVFMFDAVEASKRIKLRRNSVRQVLSLEGQGGKIIW